MLSKEPGGTSKSLRRSSGQLGLTVEDRFRFTIVISFLSLGLIGLGGMFYFSDIQAKRFREDAANLAVARWSSNSHVGFDHLIYPRTNESDEIVPVILEPNRKIPRTLLPDHLSKSNVTLIASTNNEMLWVINRHPLIEANMALILGEKDYPELKIARESVVFQRWLAASLLLVLTFSCFVFSLFCKHYIFKPLHLLHDALLSRRLTAAARVRQLHKAKITVERQEEQSRFPLEQFESDEFGQIAFILEDEDRRQKALRDNWLKTFNTINEPIAVFGQNARLRHVNEAMEEFLDEIGLDPELVKNLSANAFLNSYLQLDDESSIRLHKILNQKHPKVQAIPCNIELPEGIRNFRYSISTFVNHGERFAIFTLIKEHVFGASTNFEDIIIEQANSQLKIIHRIQQAARDTNENRSESLIHLCETLVDNIHSLLEISNASNPSLASHKVEFNIHHFFREIQESSESSMKISVDVEKTLPSFIVGDPTHLRQFLKGIFQSYQETNSHNALSMNIGYNVESKKLIISILSSNGNSVLRDPSLHLYLSHYSPFLSLSSYPENELHADEFIRLQIAVQAGINRIEALDLDLSNRLLPTSLIVVSDDLLPSEAKECIESAGVTNSEWLTPAEALERKFLNDGECMLIFISNTQKLKEKQIQKIISVAREKRIPSILLSQQPRRGESLTALRLGFVSYLTLPFEHEELHKLLILTMNKTVRESIGKLGLITKHTVRDLVPSLGKVLLGNISRKHDRDAITLMNTLTNLGFRVQETSTVHSFFELIHKGTFEYIACPDGLSTGLKRRIQVSSRDIPCVVFGETFREEFPRGEENRNTTSNTPVSWVKIEDVGDQQVVKEALKAAQERERTITEYTDFESDSDSENSNESDDTLGVAI